MEGDANLPAQSARTRMNDNPCSTINHESPFPSTSSSVSSFSSKPSRPILLPGVQAAFKRHRSLAPMLPNKPMPRRGLVPQETSNGSVSTSLPKVNVDNPKSVVSLSRNLDKSFLSESSKTNNVIEQAHQEVASITPPSVAGTMTDHVIDGRNQNNPTTSCKGSGTLAPVVEGSKKVHFSLETNAAPQGAHDQMATGMDTLCSHVDSLALTEMEWDTSNLTESSNAVNDEPKNLTLQSVDMDAGLRGDGLSSTYGVRMSTWQDQLHRNFLQTDGNHPMTQSSACATSISVHATSAPILNATTNCSSSTVDGAPQAAAKTSDPSMPPQRMPNNAVGSNQVSSSGADTQEGMQQGNVQRDRVSSVDPSVPDNNSVRAERNEGLAQEQKPGSEGFSLDGKIDSSKAENLDKPRSDKGAQARKKKNYDPEMFFKVNSKLYQRLGKIGSGGSSEVHKVISSDCTIYALKKIKLKGRDYATAYGFCQEILYLTKLKGKSNIIQLIDYEVTDKALLHEVMDSSEVNKDSKVREDGYIYMVLEYGEIDLAHMLSQKWKEMDQSNSFMDENWLRFYWQQILQAVKTIHDERIVHSDLKPANFLLVKGSLKLIDFGIAKAIMSDTTNIQRDSQVGTLSYMSPEAFLCNDLDGHGQIIKCGRSSDIWSLGCILYQMVYGRTPFSDYKTFWSKYKVITDPNHEIVYEPLSNPWLVDIMKRCLAWDRDKRWRIPQLLRHPFLVPCPPVQHPSNPLDKKYGLIDVIAQSCGGNIDASALCCQIQQLLDARPASRDEQCKLLSHISDMWSKLKEESSGTST